MSFQYRGYTVTWDKDQKVWHARTGEGLYERSLWRTSLGLVVACIDFRHTEGHRSCQ